MVMTSKKLVLNPQIYVADLAAYNAGILHGCWLEATLSEEEIWEAIGMMLASSPVGEEAQEHAIHDYSDFWEAELGESTSIGDVVATARFLVEHGRLGAKVFEYYGNLEEARSAIEERYCGEYESVVDFAELLTEETQQIPQNLSDYIDYEKIARDLELGGEIFTIEISFDRVHVFWSR